MNIDPEIGIRRIVRALPASADVLRRLGIDVTATDSLRIACVRAGITLAEVERALASIDWSAELNKHETRPAGRSDMTQRQRFQDKVCVVTGGGSGIGRAACLQFASEGGRVAVVDRNTEHGQETCRMITDGGGEPMFAEADVGKPEDIRATVDAVVKRWGKIHVVVNDAAMMTFKPVTELPDEDFDKVLNVNLRSVFLFSKYSVPHMPAGGSFVNISSVHAHETTENVVPYATSKGGMEAFIRGFAREVAHRKIRVNCVAPGAVDTPMLWNNPNVKSGAEKVTGAIGKPEDIAAAICFLAADEARFITGTTLIVDGGRLDIL